MASTTTGRKQGRRLSLIFFVDASRTRTVQLPLGAVLGVMGAGVAVVLWSLLSVVVIEQSRRREHDLSEKLRAAMDTIFEFQATFENIYEQTYSNETRPAAEG